MSYFVVKKVIAYIVVESFTKNLIDFTKFYEELKYLVSTISRCYPRDLRKFVMDMNFHIQDINFRAMWHQSLTVIDLEIFICGTSSYPRRTFEVTEDNISLSDTLNILVLH